MRHDYDRQRRRADTPERYTHCQEILGIARRCALKLQLPPDAAEDCALSFIERVLLDETEGALRPPETRHLTGTLHAPWVARAALNHAHNFRRSTRRIEHCERPSSGGMEDVAVPDGSPGAEALLMSGAVLKVLRSGVLDLAPGPRDLVLGYYVEGLSVGQIAAATGRTPHAVEQALLRARRRVRAYLERRGWGAEELRMHLASAPGTRFWPAREDASPPRPT